MKKRMKNDGKWEGKVTGEDESKKCEGNSKDNGCPMNKAKVDRAFDRGTF